MKVEDDDGDGVRHRADCSAEDEWDGRQEGLGHDGMTDNAGAECTYPNGRGGGGVVDGADDDGWLLMSLQVDSESVQMWADCLVCVRNWGSSCSAERFGCDWVDGNFGWLSIWWVGSVNRSCRMT